jgi:hypothetical protein
VNYGGVPVPCRKRDCAGTDHPDASTLSTAYALEAQADHPSDAEVREAFQQKYGVAPDAR